MRRRLMVTFALSLATAGLALADEGPLPSSPAELSQALSLENYDFETVRRIVVASDLPDYQKEGIVDGLGRFEDNPTALDSILQQTRDALGVPDG